MPSMVAYWTPKEGTEFSEWEDGAAYSQQTGWFAVADGASTGSNSREWAYTLTSAFIRERAAEVFDDPENGFSHWLRRTRAAFDPRSDQFLPSKAPRWVQTAASERGSHATLLAGRIFQGTVQAVAVGDCCLFKWTNGAPVEPFPLAEPGDFGSNPLLVRSHQSDDDHRVSDVHRFNCQLAPGDFVFVASDALAEWLTGQLRNQQVWRMLARLGNTGFQDLCRDLRTHHHMKNDDVTLFRAGM